MHLIFCRTIDHTAFVVCSKRGVVTFEWTETTLAHFSSHYRVSTPVEHWLECFTISNTAQKMAKFAFHNGQSMIEMVFCLKKLFWSTVRKICSYCLSERQHNAVSRLFLIDGVSPELFNWSIKTIFVITKTIFEQNTF